MMADRGKERWKVLSSQYLIRKPWLTARVDKLELPDGRCPRCKQPKEKFNRA